MTLSPTTPTAPTPTPTPTPTPRKPLTELLRKPLRIDALPDVPRWAAVAAHAVPLLVLPSGIWRIALSLRLPVATVDAPTLGQDVFQIVLTVVAELLAFLTLGLVRSWGEVYPRRLPLLGGRPVSRRGATAAALGGAAGLFALTGWYTYVAVSGIARDVEGIHVADGFQEVLFLVCYLPLAAWAPLLAAVAVAYSRRRSCRRTRVQGSVQGSV
ncbi:hypothetical protein [Streptomyces sp. NPDC047981]|uniref:hypothetical protein n=1 Tax=Streptomyces sp. NPDC047981 TaxID=3154610 RepID=UPI003413E65C